MSSLEGRRVARHWLHPLSWQSGIFSHRHSRRRRRRLGRRLAAVVGSETERLAFRLRSRRLSRLALPSSSRLPKRKIIPCRPGAISAPLLLRPKPATCHLRPEREKRRPPCFLFHWWNKRSIGHLEKTVRFESSTLPETMVSVCGQAKRGTTPRFSS